MLRTKFGIELLAVYAYPAQVIFCARPFTGLSDLVVSPHPHLVGWAIGDDGCIGGDTGAHPVRRDCQFDPDRVVDCAITGTLSGNEIGLPNVTSYHLSDGDKLGPVVLWCECRGVEALPTDLRTTLKEAIAGLEREIWDAADREDRGWSGVRHWRSRLQRRT